jgi:hypothetical protein
MQRRVDWEEGAGMRCREDTEAHATHTENRSSRKQKACLPANTQKGSSSQTDTLFLLQKMQHYWWKPEGSRTVTQHAQ